MKLLKYKSGNNNILHEDITVGCYKAKLYYVTNGRNAWHSTYVKQYGVGCIHSSLISAKDYIESIRVQGSQFFIKEIPALVYETKKGFILILERNTDEPLDEFSYDSICISNGFGKPEIHKLPTEGSSINDVVLAFSPPDYSNNNFKREKWLAKRNWGVYIYYLDNKNIQFEQYNGRDAKLYSSYSLGGSCFLTYSVSFAAINDVHIDSIVNFYSKSNIGGYIDVLLYDYLVCQGVIDKSVYDIDCEAFYKKINTKDYPRGKQIWVNDVMNVLDEKTFEDVNKILKHTQVVSKQKNRVFFPLIDVFKDAVISVIYPLSFLREIMTSSYGVNKEAFVHLKVILIKAKIRYKSKGNVVICFYDGFLNCRLFCFNLSKTKEQLVESLKFISFDITDSFDLLDDELIYENRVYLYENGDWKESNSIPFIVNLFSSNKLS